MTIIKTGVGTIVGANVIGSLPNIGNSTAVSGLKGNAVRGIGNVARTIPTQGKIKGTTMVLKQFGKFKFKKLKGGRKK